jgi:hypothetical protein
MRSAEFEKPKLELKKSGAWESGADGWETGADDFRASKAPVRMME